MKKNKDIFAKCLNIYPDDDIDLNYYKRRSCTAFNVGNCSKLFFELVLINKNFEKKDFEIELVFEITDLRCEQAYEETIKQFISKNEYEIVIIRSIDIKNLVHPDFTGMNFSAYYIYNNSELATISFTVYNGKKVTKDMNTFIKIKDLILYRNDIEINHKVFDKTITNEINLKLFCEFNFGITHFQRYELFFLLRNFNRRIIYEQRYFEEYDYKDDTIIEVELDSKLVSKLKPGKYSIEIEFFNTVIKEINFEISDYDEISSDDERSHKVLNQRIAIDDDDDFLEGLNNLAGLDEIKEKLKKIRKFKEYLKVKDKFLNSAEKHKDRFYFWFSGNPGTGKTKVALELGKILKNLGVLSTGNVYSVGRNHLIGQYIGQTAIKTEEAINKARGGILFIDEAYSLFKGSDYKDYGYEVIELLLSEMSNGPGDLSIIVAGYPKEMNLLKTSNPGLFSRFNYVFDFPDYNPDELLTIAKKKAKARGLIISNDAIKYLNEKIVDIYRTRENNFGNARFINSVIEKAEINLASRSSGEYAEEKIELKLDVEDFKEVFKINMREKYNTDIDELSLSRSIEELNKLTGIKNIKTEIEDLTKLLKYYQEEGIDYDKRNFSLHTVFKGNPGTGKTTVARILAKIYKSLGVLEKGHIVECDRSSLVKGYIGQTAIQTNQMIERAMGGILFIDEAYSLTNKSDRDFGIEAVEIILKRMEDSRGKFIVICAGYTDEMNLFLESNPGLKSRFDKVFVFQDYSKDELYAILISILSFYNLEAIKEDVIKSLKEIINKVFKSKDKHFGNAREIRKIAEQIVRNHDLRFASLTKYERKDLNLNEIDIKDLTITFSEIKAEKIKVGFTLYE